MRRKSGVAPPRKLCPLLDLPLNGWIRGSSSHNCKTCMIACNRLLSFDKISAQRGCRRQVQYERKTIQSVLVNLGLTTICCIHDSYDASNRHWSSASRDKTRTVSWCCRPSHDGQYEENHGLSRSILRTNFALDPSELVAKICIRALALNA